MSTSQACQSPRQAVVELLAPARNLEVARQAVLHGADAVYMGGPSHGARAAAANSLADIEAAARFAHLYKARLYVTLNTLVYDNELEQVARTVRQLHEAGVDALIVQDMALLELDGLPPMELHASTQCDIRTPQRAAMLARAGFSRLVLPRELTLDETLAIRNAVGPEVELEAFVHGALCVCFSGDCRASWLATGRSANRGECAQLCRLPYELVDGRTGRPLGAPAHYLSLRDLNRSERLGQMLDAGVNSFKIEGRLKDAAYVKNAVGAYRRLLDQALEGRQGMGRVSVGTPGLTFEPDLSEGFNRGYTTYFTDLARPAAGASMASLATPKSTGPEAACAVRQLSPRRIEVAPLPGVVLANGDGLGFVNAAGAFEGFRVNKVEGRVVHTASDVELRPGTILHRSHNQQRERLLEGDTASRSIALNAVLEAVPDLPDTLRLVLTDEGGRRAEATAECPQQEAQSPQQERRRATLAKLGGTPWHLDSLADHLPSGRFVPLGLLADLRRRAVEALTAEAEKPPLPPCLPPRRAVEIGVPGPEALNIANSLAERFYRRRGLDAAACSEARAAECRPRTPTKEPVRVMTTRYCLRRELGCCLRQGGGSKLPSDLRLRASSGAEYALRFDCNACCMHVDALPRRSAGPIS